MKGLLALLFGFGLYKLTRPSAPAPVGVRAASVDGREYEVFRRGGGTYEVVSRNDPGTFVVFGQTGEIDARGNEGDLAQVRADMMRFPKDLFA